MSKTNELRALIVSELNSISGNNGVYYQIANENSIFPHIVFDFDSVNTLADDRCRENYKLIIDVWDRCTSASLVNDIADNVEGILHDVNLPQTNILPTIYLDSRRNLRDEDKLIRHIQLTFSIQIYERN